MATAMYIKTTVLPGGKIEVRMPELVEGQQATVFVVIEEETQAPKEWQLNKLPSNLVPKLEFGNEIAEVI